MRTTRKNGKLRWILVVVPILFGWCASSYATGLFSFGDVEKPNPEFTQTGGRTIAKFIPRAKSTSVTVEFEVTEGGSLAGVKGIDFAMVDRPEVDVKNFKSAVFEIAIRDVIRGGTATAAIRSDFFSLSTAYYVFNPKRVEPWIRDAQKENRLLEQRVRELVVQVQDGGDLDADGEADGQIRLVGGPRDSFWGYALGTLFIRFFGIFFVLSLLMIGMFASGWIFTLLDRIRGGRGSAGEEKKAPAAAEPPVESARFDRRIGPAGGCARYGGCRHRGGPVPAGHCFPDGVFPRTAGYRHGLDHARAPADHAGPAGGISPWGEKKRRIRS